MALRNIALLGASGNIGRFISSALHNDQTFNTTIITRHSSTVDFGTANVIKVSDSYPPDEMVRAFTGQDAVILAIPYKVEKLQRSIIDSAIKAGVKRLIPSHFGGNAENPTMLAFESRGAKLDSIIHYLRTKESELTWTTTVTGIFFDLALSNGFLGYRLSSHEASIWNDGSSTFSASTRNHIGDAVVAVLHNPALTANRVVYTSSFETSQNEILACLEDVTREKWEVTKVEADPIVKEAKATLASGVDSLMAHGMLSLAVMYGGEEYGSDFAKNGKLWNEKLGLRRENLKDVVTSLVENSHR